MTTTPNVQLVPASPEALDQLDAILTAPTRPMPALDRLFERPTPFDKPFTPKES